VHSLVCNKLSLGMGLPKRSSLQTSLTSGLFHGDVSNPNLQHRSGKRRTGKCFGWERCYPRTHLRQTRKKQKTCNNSRYPCWDSNKVPPKHRPLGTTFCIYTYSISLTSLAGIPDLMTLFYIRSIVSELWVFIK